MVKIEQRPVTDGVNFRSIQDTRFKTMRIAVSFLLPIQKDTAAANALLPFLLARASRQYPDFTKLSQRLSELYGADINADVYKLGENQVLSIAALGLADRYALNGENISGDLAELLCGILFDPPITDGLFPLDGFHQEKRQTIEMIDSDYNDKRIFSRLRCEQIMCRDEAFGISRYGTREEIQSLKLPRMTEIWEHALKSARIEIMALGDCDPHQIYEDFVRAFSKFSRGALEKCGTKVIKTVEKARDVTETMTVAQSKLVLGFRAGAAVPQDDVVPTKLMTAVFGGTPNSKLFLNVREKLSLCYYCAARYDWNKGILLVESGVETKNIERAKDEILRQLEEIKKGNVGDEEIGAAKLSLCNSYRTIGDFLGGLESWYLSQTFCKNVLSPEEAARQIRAVTKEQIVAAARNVVLDTVYRLEGKGEDQHGNEEDHK